MTYISKELKDFTFIFIYKYIDIKEVILFNLIKVTNLYPRLIFYQNYADNALSISKQNSL